VLYERVRSSSHRGHSTCVVLDNALVGTNAVESGVSHALSTTTGTTVFASLTSLVIDVVIENAGASPEVQVPVTLTVMAGGQNLYTQTQKIPEVSAHAQATAAFTRLQLPPSAFSHNATISVSIRKVQGEARLDNNTATYPVFFRLASG